MMDHANRVYEAHKAEWAQAHHTEVEGLKHRAEQLLEAQKAAYEAKLNAAIGAGRALEAELAKKNEAVGFANQQAQRLQDERDRYEQSINQLIAQRQSREQLDADVAQQHQDALERLRTNVSEAEVSRDDALAKFFCRKRRTSERGSDIKGPIGGNDIAERAFRVRQQGHVRQRGCH